MGNLDHFKGASAEMLVASRYLAKGWQVFHPLLTQSKADLVVIDLEGVCHKVQVKASSLKKGVTANHKPYYQVRLGGAGRPDYKDGDFDILAVVTGDKVVTFTWDEVKGKSSLCVGKRNKGIEL